MGRRTPKPADLTRTRAHTPTNQPSGAAPAPLGLIQLYHHRLALAPPSIISMSL